MAMVWNNKGFPFFALYLSHNKSFGFNYSNFFNFLNFREH